MIANPFTKINVLDHGFVRLVDSMGNDLSVVRAARVSYDAYWRAGEDEGSDQRLINYLWKHRHTTPFEAVTLTFEIYAPIFVLRQWHRHRTWSYNELSARYRPLPEVFYVPNPSLIGEQSTDNKQGRRLDADLEAMRQKEIEILAKACKHSFETYDFLLDAGWPRELARSVLPVNTYSHMFATVNLLNLMKFLTLRCDEHAQYEIRVYANTMRDLLPRRLRQLAWLHGEATNERQGQTPAPRQAQGGRAPYRAPPRVCEDNRYNNWLKGAALRLYRLHDPLRAAVESMTNWQRHQYAKLPVKERSLANAKRCAEMVHP